MALTINSALISAQAQAYAAPKKEARAFTPPPLDQTAARSRDEAVRVEISSRAADTDRQQRQPRELADGRDTARSRDTGPARDFAREAPLKSAQKETGARDTRPGSTLDIRV